MDHASSRKLQCPTRIVVVAGRLRGSAGRLTVAPVASINASNRVDLPLPCGPTRATDRGFSPFLLLDMAAPPSFAEALPRFASQSTWAPGAPAKECSANSTVRESPFGRRFQTGSGAVDLAGRFKPSCNFRQYTVERVQVGTAEVAKQHGFQPGSQRHEFGVHGGALAREPQQPATPVIRILALPQQPFGDQTLRGTTDFDLIHQSVLPDSGRRQRAMLGDDTQRANFRYREVERPHIIFSEHAVDRISYHHQSERQKGPKTKLRHTVVAILDRHELPPSRVEAPYSIAMVKIKPNIGSSRRCLT